MKKSTLFFTFLLLVGFSAFSQDAQQLQQTAKTFMMQGDFSNAVLVLNRAIAMNPGNIEMAKDLAFDYYMQKDYDKALATIKPVIDGKDADDQSYQIAGNIYIALNLTKDCEKLYRRGIEKFPESGALYNELGELLGSQGDQDAIKQWEKGIEIDPSYSKNYYNASRYYSMVGDYIWSVIYGEIFLNMEPLSPYTPELKGITLQNYEKIFADADLTKKNKDKKNKFATAFITCLNKQSNMATMGINPESLTMIRTRFILDWNKDYAAKFPFRLFDWQQQLLQQGLFDAYNQWIFGMAQNLSAYQTWTNNHAAEYTGFDNLQKGRIFKVPAGQYYH
ncbi:MAG TPA: tetratricopeptide repeat protein [Ferruginibacter sp.]|nr:tetratricopeptide repeat protein [Ferruginibacter sp.]